jgi:hypothetical protein
MATSGTQVFTFDAAEATEEAFERCGRESRTGYDLQTAIRSMNLMVSDWANKGINLWTVKTREEPMETSENEYVLDGDVIDIISAVIVRSGTDLSMGRISREQFLTTPVKTTLGRPSQWYLDRQIIPNLKVYPTPENSTDVFKYDVLIRIEDIKTGTDTIAIPFRFYEAFMAELASKIAEKKAPDRSEILDAKAIVKFDLAAAEDRDRAAFQITPDLAIYYRAFR